jgi:regulator of sigma E protease
MLDFAHKALIDFVTWLPMVTLIITIHELGHYSVARACGVAVERFSLGFGPTLVSWRARSGTEWRIGWILLGGYVRFAGDANAASVPDASDLESLRAQIVEAEGPGEERKYFAFKPVWQRALVVAAGPMANFVLAIVLFAILLGAFGEMVQPARVDGFKAPSVAAQAGFRPGDVIVQAGTQPIASFDDLVQYVAYRAHVPTVFEVERAGRRVEIPVTIGERTDNDPIMGRHAVGSLGIVARPTPADYHHVTYDPLQALGGGVRKSWDILSTTVYYLGRMITGQVSANQIGGPLRTMQLSGNVATAMAHDVTDPRMKAFAVVIGLAQLAAFISVSLGFLNLLPIPVLDGGHLLFYAYEAVARRPVAAGVQAVGYRVGLALLLGLMLFATTNDLQRTHVFHFLGGPFS